MTNLLCLLLGIAIPLLALLLAARRALRPVAAAAAYRNVAWRLGLEADTRGTSIRGMLDGRRLFVGTFEDPRSRRRSHRGVLELEVPLGLGVSVTPRGMASRLRSRTQRRGPAGLIGEPELDEALEVRAPDLTRAAALFTDPVREALAALRRRWPDLELDDRAITVELRVSPPNEARLRELIEALRAVAVAVEHARRGIAVDETLAPVSAAWAALAPEIGLSPYPELPALLGDRGGRRVAVYTVLGPDGWRAHVRVLLAAHPATGLRLRPQTGGVPLGAGRQDIVVDDPPFDDAFIVVGYDPTTIRGLLNPPARAALLDAAAQGHATLSDERIELSNLPVDAEAVQRAVATCHAIADAIGW